MGCFKIFKFWRKRDERANLEKRTELREKIEEEAKKKATISTLLEKVQELEERQEEYVYGKEAIISNLDEKLEELQQKVDEGKDATICNLDYIECEKEQEELITRFLSLELKRKDSEINTLKTTHHGQISRLQNELKEKDSEIEQQQAKITELKTKLRTNIFFSTMKTTFACSEHSKTIASLNKKNEEKDSEIVQLKKRISVLEKQQNDFEKKPKETERCLEAVTKLNAVKRSLICFCLVTLSSVLFFWT
jgi:chromosome segregation ATPase